MARASSRKLAEKKPPDSSLGEIPPGVALLPAAQISALSGDPNFMTSLARGLAVIQAYSHAKALLTISQLSTATGLSRAAVRRCMYTLGKLGLADSEDGRHFSLKPRILTLGHSYVASMPLAKIAQPVLDRVSQLLRESCSIGMLDGRDIIHVANANVTRILAIDLAIGSRVPALYTSMGRVLLAYLPPGELESYLAHAEFTSYTERSIASADKMREALQLVRRNGYALVDQELELGLRAIAVPIHNTDGKAIAALNVGAHAQRVSVQDMLSKFLLQLQAAAQELSMLLK
ncbi:MAG: helix-turn-helix domain-containing protein [Acidobacteriia bacterium]|nr:helix-turn-helix domain-containing protein [Terriglobia bacterium]